MTGRNELGLLIQTNNLKNIHIDWVTQSLQPKTEWEVEFINGKIELV